jgi:hypothetical protein
MRSVDRFVEKVPVLGGLLGGTLISVPVRITGDIKDPQVNAFSLSSADSGLLGIMKKTLVLPFRVFTPGAAGGAKEEGESAR